MQELTLEQLQAKFNELTKELKQPLPTDVYNKIWDERVWIKSLIAQYKKKDI